MKSNSFKQNISSNKKMKISEELDKDQLKFAENYNEENDDELNGLYSHYQIVKKILTQIIEIYLIIKNIENYGETQLLSMLLPSSHFI